MCVRAVMQFVCEPCHASNASDVRTINVCASKARASKACVSNVCKQSESAISENICNAETMLNAEPCTANEVLPKLEVIFLPPGFFS